MGIFFKKTCRVRKLKEYIIMQIFPNNINVIHPYLGEDTFFGRSVDFFYSLKV